MKPGSFARRVISEFLPPRLGRAPYAAALSATQRFLAFRHGSDPTLWARNSYALGTLRPLLSDIDLTLWFEKKTDKLIDAALRDLSRVKRIAPIMGEVNVYVKEEIGGFLPFANPYELARDPELMRILDCPPQTRSREEAAVFLLRLLESDLKHLLDPELASTRKAKWRHHCEAVGLAGPEGVPKVEDVLEKALALLPNFPEAPGSLRNYYSVRGRTDDLREIPVTMTTWAFQPHRLCYRQAAPVFARNSFLAVIFRKQVEWEIWGLYAHCRSIRDRAGFDLHLESLDQCVETALREDPPAAERLREGITHLRQLRRLITL